MRFLDANVLIRYITGDVPQHLDACTALFRRLHSGEEHVYTSEVVIAEVVYVLSSRLLYQLGAADVASRLKPLVLLRGVSVPHKQTVISALDIYAGAGSIDFEDALQIAHMRRLGVSEIYSYDRHFDRFRGQVHRIEP